MVKILVEKIDNGRQVTIEMKDGDAFDRLSETAAGVMKLCEGLANGDMFEAHAFMYSIGMELVDTALKYKNDN